MSFFFFFFFFQAEDGIRDKLVTGVQTCALPISCARCGASTATRLLLNKRDRPTVSAPAGARPLPDADERRRLTSDDALVFMHDRPASRGLRDPIEDPGNSQQSGRAGDVGE